MIEKCFIEEDSRYPKEFTVQMYDELTACENVEEIERQKPEKDGEYFICRTNMKAIDKFLKARFEMGIYRFISSFMYTLFGEMAVLPITAEKFVLILRKESFSPKIAKQFSYDMENRQSDGIYVVTLIESDFSLNEHSGELAGITCQTKDYNLLVEASSVTELIVFYEKKTT